MQQVMKESHLYERPIQNMSKKLSQSVGDKQSSMTSSNKTQLIDPLFKLMEFLVQSEQRIQIYKEMLCERGDFNPQILFAWITKSQPHIDKRHLLSLFQQNSFPCLPQQFIKIYFNSYSYKQKLDYSAFVNMIFPQNNDLIKHISVSGIKKYPTNTMLTQEVLCIFLMLVSEEVRLVEEFDAMKTQLIPKITRKEIKNLMRIMKKNGESNSLMEIDSRPFVKYQELKGLFKSYTSKNTKATVKQPTVGNNPNKKGMKKQKQPVKQPINNQHSIMNTSFFNYLQKNSLSIFRKLSMGKTDFISLEDFEFWLRPWNKQRGSLNIGEECSSNIFTISGSVINQIEESKVSFGENENLPLSHQANVLV